MLVTKQVAGQYFRERQIKMTDNKSHPEPVVYLVDNNPQTSLAVAELIKTFGHQVRLFESVEMFLENVDESRPGCVVLDIRLSSLGNTDVQQKLKQRGIAVPVIMLTSSADTSQTVRSLLNGAFIVLDKPFRDDELWSTIQDALQHSKSECNRHRHVASLENRLKKLAPQDRTVLQLMLEGMKNRSIAKRLDVSLRTVENRRRRVFDVMRADSVAQLTRMVVEYEYSLPPAADSNDIWLSLPFEKAAC